MSMFYWERFLEAHAAGNTNREGAALQRLRRGTNVEAGASPEMWAYYTQLDDEGRLTRKLRCEHVALTVFATHQQSQSYCVHSKDIGLGRALAALKASGRFSEDAVDRHVMQLATASQLGEIARHLRSLVSLMKASKAPIAFDYTQLFWDLYNLDDPESAGRVRRRWASGYFAKPQSANQTATI